MWHLQLQHDPRLAAVPEPATDGEQGKENWGYFFVGETAVDPVISFKASTGAENPQALYGPWACKALKTLSQRFKKSAKQTALDLVPQSLLARIAGLKKLEELFLEQADPENENENEVSEGESESKGRDPLEELIAPEGMRHLCTGFLLMMGLRRLKRFVLIIMDLALVDPACATLESLLPGLQEPIRVWEKSRIGTR
ncbi:hypothetical protein BGZ81_002714 [Podila clonocystis]|nr:hypothetical protein BGZ81_002714 [Podila clonocystis]